ncbi:MAG: sulfocyanin-like copper-binding protein [Motilibacteraceae bacterium]
MSLIGRRAVLAGTAATLLLTGASLAAVAAAAPGTRTAPCSPPAAQPGSRVTVLLVDMGGAMTGPMSGPMMGGPDGPGQRMMLRAAPGHVAAGTVTFVAVDRGHSTHELVVLPLAAGATAGSRDVRADGTVDEAAALGEASRSCGAGAGDGIAAGSAGWVTLTLPAGRYELLCDLPGHYAAGMWTELDVR